MSNKIEGANACPFCGLTNLRFGELKAEEDPNWTIAHYVECQNCLARGRCHYPIGWVESQKAAIEAWNDRKVAAAVNLSKALSEAAKDIDSAIFKLRNLR